jgi:hypothetical protein
MNDFTTLLDEIKAAYQSQNLRPIRGQFFISDQSGDLACPLVAAAMQLGIVDKNDPDLTLDQAANPAFDWACEQFGEDWSIGFLDGFDGKPQGRGDPSYLAGYGLGTLVAQHV